MACHLLKTFYKMKKIYISELLNEINVEKTVISDNQEIYFDNVSNIKNAIPNSLIWIAPETFNTEKIISKTKASVIVVDKRVKKIVRKNKALILVENPRKVFISIVKSFILEKKEHNIHPTAIIHPKAKVHKNVSIGEYSVIGNCVINKNVEIGSFCKILDNTQIGECSRIKSGAVIGERGFGYSKNNDKSYEHFPHLGGVKIGKNVDIGSNSCIDKGTLDYTIIQSGVKIDNLVHIGHNAFIGKNTIIVAQSLIGGSATIGRNTWIAPFVCIRDRISVGKNVTIGMNSLVTKNIPDNEIWFGIPAKKTEKHND